MTSTILKTNVALPSKNSVTDASQIASLPRSADRLLNIDCLRGLAALEVFVFHVSCAAGFEKRTLPAFRFRYGTVTLPNFLSLGASGVSLFFVISGFCLALQQWRAKRETLGVDCAPYFRNRFARIVPAYWAPFLSPHCYLLFRVPGPVP
jgi:peptidoglycan/LPS O-acetylase OafA/YrhL